MLSTLNTIVNTQCTSLLVFEYEVDYKLHSEEHLEVYYVGTNGTESLLDPDSEYSVKAMTDTGFKVVLVTSYDEGLISIRRRTGQQQEADFPPGGDFPADTFERSLDKLTMMVQELREELDRSIRTPLIEEPSDLILPRAKDRANKFVAFNNDGSEVIASVGTEGDTPIENTIWDKLQFNDDPPTPSSEPAGQLWWNKDDSALNIATGLGPVLQVGQEMYVIVYNGTGAALSNGTVVYPIGGFQGRPSVAKANSLSHVKILGEVLVTTMDIPNGEFGISTQSGNVRGVDTSTFNLGDTLWVSDTVDGGITNVKPEFPSYSIQIGGVTVKDAIDGEILVGIKGVPEDTVLNFWNGVFRETFDLLVTSDGTTITGSLSPTNGHDDMTMIFSDGFTVIETTPAITISLVPGSDTVPVLNYIYIPKTTKVLTVSTTGWPSTEHIKVASVYLKTAATTQTDGALKNQNWNDGIQNTNTHQGHLSHIGERLRQEQAKWDTGVLGAANITGSPDDVFFSVTSGYVYQMHKQLFSSLDMATGDHAYVVNNFTNSFKKVTNLNSETSDSLGVTLANRSFSFVAWGVQNKTGEQSHLMVNLPSGSYAKNSPDNAVDDAKNYSSYDIPKEFQGVGFLIARFTFVLDALGTGWTLYDTQDLRGKIPSNVAGGSSGGGTDATSIPIGSVMPWTTATAPAGYLLCDGSAKNRTTYSDLFNVIGTDYGVGDGSTTFNLPKSDYETEWINRSDWTNVHLGSDTIKNVDSNIAHGLGVPLSDLIVKVLISTDGTDANSFVTIPYARYRADIAKQIGMGILAVDDDNFIIQTGTDGFVKILDSGGTSVITNSDWYYKITVERKDFPKGSIIRATNTSVTLEDVTSSTIADLTVINSAQFTPKIQANGGVTVPVLHVQDQKTSGTSGGTFTSGAWRTRTLNTTPTNTITGASLNISNNQITLPAGTYKIRGSAPANYVTRHITRLYNITDSSVAITGLSSYSNTSYGDMNISNIIGQFTIVSSKVFELQHRCETTKTTDGFGVSVGSAFTVDHETYSDVFIEKIG